MGKGRGSRLIITISEKRGEGQSLVGKPENGVVGTGGGHKLGDRDRERKLENKRIIIEAKLQEIRGGGISLNENIFRENNVVTSNLNTVSFEQLKTKIQPHRRTIMITVVVNGVDGSIGTQGGSSVGAGMILRVLGLLTGSGM